MVTVAFLSALPSLVAAGLATVAQVKTMLASLHPGMTETEMNAICDLVAAGAARHQALAEADSKPA